MFYDSYILTDVFKYLTRIEIEQIRFVAKFWDNLIYGPRDVWPRHKITTTTIEQVNDLNNPFIAPEESCNLQTQAMRAKTSYLEDKKLMGSDDIKLFLDSMRALVEINHEPIIIPKLWFMVESMSDYLDDYSDSLELIFGEVLLVNLAEIHVRQRGLVEGVLATYPWPALPSKVKFMLSNFNENMDLSIDEVIKIFETFGRFDKEVEVPLDGVRPGNIEEGATWWSSIFDEAIRRWFRNLKSEKQFKITVNFVEYHPTEEDPPNLATEEIKKSDFEVKKNSMVLKRETSDVDMLTKISYTVQNLSE